VKKEGSWSECFEMHKNKRGIHKSTNMQLTELLSVLQSFKILCEI